MSPPLFLRSIDCTEKHLEIDRLKPMLCDTLHRRDCACKLGRNEGQDQNVTETGAANGLRTRIAKSKVFSYIGVMHWYILL